MYNHQEISVFPALRNGYQVASARFSSDLGAFMNMVALSSYMFLLTNSSIYVGLFLALRVFGGVCASLMATLLFRRFAGQWPLMIFDLIRASAIGTLLIFPAEFHLPLLFFIAYILGLTSTFFSVGLNSQLASFVGQEHLGKVNVWIASLSSIGMVIGSLIAGGVIALWGHASVFLLNVGTYLISGLLIGTISVSKQVNTTEHSKPSFKKDLSNLLDGLKQHPMMKAMLLVALADTLGSASHNVGYPIFSTYFEGKDPAQIMGYMLAIWAVGKLLGAKLIRYIGWLEKSHLEKMEIGFFCGILLMSSGFILAFNQTELWLSLAFFMLAGLGDGIAEVCFITRAQLTPTQIRLPIFSLITLLQTLGFGVGMVVCSFFFDFFSAGKVVFLFHMIPIMTVVVSFLLTNRVKRRQTE